MISQMVADNVRVVVADADMWVTPLTIEEERLLAGAVDKRKREYRAGRNAAKQAILQLGYDKPFLIMKEGNRKPAWPPGIVGSITHTGSYCAAAVAYSKDYAGIGIDVEKTKPLSSALAAKVCTSREREWIKARQQVGDKTPWCMVIFSIKESIYKLFNPIHQVFLGFLEAEVKLTPSGYSFTAEILQQKHNVRCSYSGDFRVDEGFIYSVVLETASARDS